MPRKELREESGVINDFNYISQMEQKIGRSEREIVEEKGLLRKDDLRPAMLRETKWATGKDGRKRKIVVTRMLKDNGRPTMPRGLAKRLEDLGVKMLHAPTGMQRQKDNKTSYNRFQGFVNWTVEWLVLQEDGQVKEHVTGRSRDDIPIFRAYHDWLDTVKAKEHDSKRWGEKKGARFFHQVPWTRTWNAVPDTAQEPATGCWAFASSLEVTGSWPSELEQQKRDAFDYFLANPRQRADQPKKVTRLEVGESLREILRNTNVLEYPTIYMIRKGVTLPPGFVLAPKDLAAPLGTKRPNPPEKKSQASKRRKTKDLEEGEVMSDGGDAAGDDKSSVAGSTGTGGNDDDSVPAGALEVGDIVAEESFDEDEDGDGDENANEGLSGGDHASDWDSETSSEGTTSSDEDSDEGA